MHIVIVFFHYLRKRRYPNAPCFYEKKWLSILKAKKEIWLEEIGFTLKKKDNVDPGLSEDTLRSFSHYRFMLSSLPEP